MKLVYMVDHYNVFLVLGFPCVNTTGYLHLMALLYTQMTRHLYICIVDVLDRFTSCTISGLTTTRFYLLCAVDDWNWVGNLIYVSSDLDQLYACTSS